MSNLLKTILKSLAKKLGIYKAPHDYFSESTCAYWVKPQVTVWYDKSNPEWTLWRDALTVWRPTLLACRLSVIETEDREHADIVAGRYLDYSGGAGVDKFGFNDPVIAPGAHVIESTELSLSLHRRGESTADKVQVLRHEWGHALGLPHSLSDDDLMYSTVKVRDPSSTDKNTLIMVYDWRLREIGF